MLQVQSLNLHSLFFMTKES